MRTAQATSERGPFAWASGGPHARFAAVLALVLVGAGCAAGGGPAPGRAPASPVAAAATLAPASAASVAEPATPVAPLRLILNYPAVNGAQTPTWVAYEAGYYREQGLDVELTAINSTARVLQAMLAGEVHISGMDPSAAIQASLEGADLVLMFASANRLIFSVLAQPVIQQPEALRGKVLGITRIGSAAHTAGRVALKGWGLVPDRDVSLRQLGEASAILAGLEARQIDGGVLSAPTSSIARLAGFTELINLNTDGPDYPSATIGAQRPWVNANEEIVRRFARAYAQGIHRFRTDKPFTFDVYRKYAKLEDPQLLEDTYAQFSGSFPDAPYVSDVGLAAMLEDLVGDDPRLAGRQAAEWIDARFVRELETSGFIRQLWGGVR